MTQVIPNIGSLLTLEDTEHVIASKPHPALMRQLRDYLLQQGAPNDRLYPRWLANKLNVGERELLGALAYGVREGIVQLHWEVYCPFCGLKPEKFASLKVAHSQIECVACDTEFDLHLDRDVRVTFSATQRMRRERNGEIVPMPRDVDEVPTRGIDLLLIPAFWELFSGDAPAADESLSISRVAILFTDLKGSTAMYADRGDPRAYRIVRDHFAILGEAIHRNNGVLVKTIGDAVMASFPSSHDAVKAAFETQAELQRRTNDKGAKLILKAGVHVGPCLLVRLNERLDFFGGAVNTAARVQGLSCGNDIIISDDVLLEINAEAEESKGFMVEKSFDARLRGLPELVRVHRLIATTLNKDSR